MAYYDDLYREAGPVRPVEDQEEFYLSESDRMMLRIYDHGNCNEDGCEVGNLDWPV